MPVSYTAEEVRAMDPVGVLGALMSRPADVYPLYDRLRETALNYLSPLGIRFLTGYEGINALLRSPAFVQADVAGDPRFADSSWLRVRRLTLLFANPPQHTRLRALVSRAFTAKAVEELRSATQKFVDAHLDRCAELEVFDLVADLGAHLPTEVITTMLGIDERDAASVASWAHAVARATSMWCDDETLAAADTATDGFMDLIGGLLEERRRQPGADMLTALLHAQEGDERLTPQEIQLLAMTLLVAGTETSTKLISTGVMHLLQHPGEVAKLQRDPGLLKPAVEELLRFDAPINASMIRVATEDTEIAGAPVGGGEQVVAFIGAGNRDPEAFDQPNRLWIDRPNPRPHLSFGNGAHFCLGSALARMQAGIVLRSLLVDRLPDLRLKPDERIEYLEDFPPLRGAARVLVCPGERGDR